MKSLSKEHFKFIHDLADKTFPDPNSVSDREMWLHRRRLGIGGSDVAAILGISPWQTPLDVYNAKRGVEPVDSSDMSEAQHFGHVLEDVVAREYARRQGVRARRRNEANFDWKDPWLIAHIDRKVVSQSRGLECKTSSAWLSSRWGESGTDEVPDYYLVQCAHYMAVTCMDEWDVAALIGGNDFRVYHLTRDPDLEAFIRERLRAFWFDHVVSGRPPEPINLDEVNRLYRVDNGEAVVAPPEVADAVARRRELKQQIKEIEGQIKPFELEIKKHLGEHQVLVDEGGKQLASWKTQTSRRFDQKSFKAAHPELAEQFTIEAQSRVFR